MAVMGWGWPREGQSYKVTRLYKVSRMRVYTNKESINLFLYV